MACPMTAGTAALVKEAHPTWAGERIRAVIQNTSDPSLLAGGFNVRRNGSGVIQADKAVTSTVIATTADGLNTLAFGYVPSTTAYQATKSFTLTNTGTSSATYALGLSPNGNQFGASISFDQPTVTLAAGESKTVNATLTIPAAAFAALPGASVFTVGLGAVVTARGLIIATPQSSGTGQHTLRVPYLVAPRGLSNVAAGTPSAFTKSQGSVVANLPLSNNGVHSGTADLYAWGVTDTKESGGSSDVRDVGVQVLPPQALDDTIPASSTDKAVIFAVNTWGQAANPSVDEFDVVIDNNGDGRPDFVVVGFDLGAVLAGAFDGRYASFIFDAAGNLVDAWLAEAPMNGSIVELPALASDIGLAPEQSGQGNGQHEDITGFAYHVNAFDLVNGNVDTTGTSGRFDVFNPPVSSGSFATLASGATASMPLSIKGTVKSKPNVLGWLVASIDDANGAAQADEVKYPVASRK
jgi:hypothetical protein